VRSIRRGIRRAASVGMVVAISSSWGSLPAAGQELNELHVAGGWTAGLLVGNASDFLDGGAGPWLSLEWIGARQPSLGVAVGVERLRLDDDTDQGTGARARNALIFASVGPTVGVWLGPMRPWVGAFAGIMSGHWTTEWRGRENDGRNAAFAWGAGAGLRARLKGGDHPISIGGEVRATKTGTLSFARAPVFGRLLRPTGLVAWDLVLLSLRLGVSVGL
jgi:hypothetical protein